jgi:nicotinamide-nucleotide amidase
MIKNIIKKLKKNKLKISIVESCTGGMLCSIFTKISGVSDVFSMGLVTYSNDSKIKILSVPKTIIAKKGAVSKECCKSMVTNLQKLSKSDVCVSITGVAGPSGGTKTKPVGTVYVGIICNKKLYLKKYNFKKYNRLEIQKATCAEILILLNKYI